MVLSIKISNINDAPNIAMGWADAVVSIYSEQSLSRPTYNKEIEQYIISIDDADEGDYKLIKLNAVIDFIQFIEALKQDSKLLVHSRTGDRRASTMIYIYYMMQHINPPTALYQLRHINPNANPIIYIVKLAEEHLKIGSSYSSFIDIWHRTTENNPLTV